MNTRLIRFGALPLYLFLAMFAVCDSARAQSLDSPPIKMGLWQTDASTSISGMENVPTAHQGQRTTVTQGCLTPESWKSSVENMQKRAKSGDCKTTNMHQDAHSLSFDESCSSERYNSDTHFEAQFDDSEHMHGSAKVKMTAQGLPQPMTANMTLNSHYLSADCGEVKPGEAKIVK
jgi:hypothetical protein